MQKQKMLFAISYASLFLDNDVEALVPELWANEALMRLENNMVMGNLVYRDYSDELANYGDTVNAHRPGEFVSKNKGVNDEVTIQAVNAATVPVRLDQHHHVSFLLRDGEEARSFKDLVNIHLVPAISALAQGVDEMIWGEAYNFMGNFTGRLGTDPTKTQLTLLKALMTNNKAPLSNRNLVISANTEAILTDIADFVNAEKVGDDGSALREGSLGRKFGFNIFATQNAPSIVAGSNDTLETTTDADIAAGDTVIPVATMTLATVGSWMTVAGDDTPQLITAATVDQLTVSPGVKYAVASGAAVVVVKPALINEALGYDQYYSKELTIDGLTMAPQVGQLISQGAYRYSAKTGSSITALEHSNTLQSAAANNDVLGLGPAGEYGFAFHPNAIALVTRPLPTPRQGTGAQSSVISFNGLSMRVTITYEGRSQGHLVTLDFLTGVKTLDTRLGALLLG